MTARIILFKKMLAAAGLFLLFGAVGCNVLKDRVAQLEPVLANGLESGLENGLSKGIQKAKLDSLVAAAADSLWKKTRRHLDSALVELPGPVYHFADSLLGQIVIRHVAALTDTLNNGLSKIKNNLTDDQLANYVNKFVNDQLGPTLNKLVRDLGATLNSPGMQHDLNALRNTLQFELDSLLRSGFSSIGTGIDSSLMSRIDTVLAHIERSGKKTSLSISNIAWVVGGIVAFLALLFFAIRTHLTKLKFRKMAEIMTIEIDRIDARPVYDKVIKNITPKMQEAGLEELLREEVLRKQGLIEQPKWESDDEKLLRQLKEKLEKSDREDFLKKMQDAGLNVR
ncbi:MAG: hypothetical protein ACKVU2_16670 [Saprospiraceae bacterium]